MSVLDIHRTQIHGLTDTEWPVSLELGVSQPPSRANIPRTTPTREREAAHVQTRKVGGPTPALPEAPVPNGWITFTLWKNWCVFPLAPTVMAAAAVPGELMLFRTGSL